MKLCLLLVLFAMLGANASIINRDKGDIPYATTKSILPEVQTAAAPGTLLDGVEFPLPADKWWTAAAVTPQTSEIAGPYPYLATVMDVGIQFCWPRDRTFDGTSVHHEWNNGYVLTVSACEIPAVTSYRKVIDWDEVGVSIQYQYEQATMISYLVQGSPYMTYTYESATPNITLFNSQTSFSSISNISTSSSPVSVTGQTFTVQVTSGITWKIYVMGGNDVTLVATDSSIIGPSSFTGTIRIAALNQQEGQSYSDTESLLDLYSPVYAMGANISYTIDEEANTANVYFDWKVIEGANADNLLLLSWPHHRKVLQTPNQVDHIQYLGVRGFQIGTLGSSWVMTHDIPEIDFHAPRDHDSSCDPLMNQYLEYDVSLIVPSVPGEFYYAGKTLSRTARLLTIADELGRSDLVPTILNLLEESFEFWINGSTKAQPGYETLWGGLVDSNGVTNVNVDFGNGFYQDHHFHYGYHLNAAAILAKYNPAWLTHEIFKPYIDELARDIGNPSSLDPFYPVTRHKDWYAGHSWAGGVGYNGGTRDEESSSECMNAYYGLYLWGISSNNAAMQDIARVLFATELNAVQSYWHLYPNVTEDTPYPEQGMRDHTSTGQIMNEQAGAWLWWGGLKTEMAAIQLMPVTPITEYIADASWVQGMVPHCESEFSDPNNALWATFVYMANGVLDPHAAFLQLQEGGYTDQIGESLTNCMWWVSTRAGTDGLTCTGSAFQVTNTSSIILAVKEGGYLAISANNDVTTVSDASSASAFNLGWTSYGYTIQSVETKLYATSDTNGDPVSVIRQVASSWEIFRFQEVNGFWAIKAQSNGMYLNMPSSSSPSYLSATVNGVGNLTSSSLFSISCQNGQASCPTTSAKVPITAAFNSHISIN